jgi:hypothetical protein
LRRAPGALGFLLTKETIVHICAVVKGAAVGFVNPVNLLVARRFRRILERISKGDAG